MNKNTITSIYPILLLLATLPAIGAAQYKGGSQDGVAQKIVTANNAQPKIYSGGREDGYATNLTVAQNTLPGIYTGGNQDGVALFTTAKNSKQNTTPEIYMGGSEDGVAAADAPWQNVTDSIYRGGNQDGVSNIRANAQNQGPDIYKGDSTDGVDMAMALQANALPEIYTGGTNDGYSIFIRNAPQNPLPLMANTGAIQFTGRWAGDDAALSWVSSNEKGIANYELERADSRNNTFTKLTTITAGVTAKNTTQGNYAYTDKGVYQQPTDFYTYRLTYKLIGDSTAYSALVRLDKNKDIAVLAVYPNPNAGYFTLSLGNVQQGYKGYGYLVTTADGRTVMQGSIQTAQTAFNLAGKAAGTYLLLVHKNGKPVQNFNIIIAH